MSLLRVSHLIELHHKHQTGPASMIEGQHEDAEQPGRAVDEAGYSAQHALLFITQLTVRKRVWKKHIHPG